MFYKILQIILQIIIKPIFRIRINGYENLPKENGYILCSNHKSNWDPVFLAIAIKDPIIFMAKKQIFDWPIIGSAVKKLGAFPVQRDGRDMASLKHSIKLIKENKILGIMPEGTRTKNIARENMKEGVTYIALKTKCNIIPVEIISTFKPFRKTYININKAIEVEKYLPLKSKEAMVKMTDELFYKIYQSHNEKLESSKDGNYNSK